MKRVKVYYRCVECITIVCLLGGLIVLGYWGYENSEATRLYNSLLKSSSSTEAVPKDAKNMPTVTMNLEMIQELPSALNVDFTTLCERNSETVGWLNIPNTKIDYPIVQRYDDNNWYLKHDFDGKFSTAGWIFLDSRNSPAMTDQNIVVYGHDRTDGSMFGSLHLLLNDKYVENGGSQYILINDMQYKRLYQIFSAYITAKNTDFNRTVFHDDEFLLYIDDIKAKNVMHGLTDITFTDTDRILTLATCNGLYNRLLVHAKLIAQVKS